MIMDKQDIDKARAAATNALMIAKPIIEAMQGAETVFSVLANAEKHKAALVAEVATLQQNQQRALQELESLGAQVVAAKAEVAAVQDAAQAKVRAMTEEAQSIVTSLNEQRVAAEATAREQHALLLAGLTSTAAQAQTEHDAYMGGLTAKRREAEDATAAIEKKLATLRAQAKKFADAFGE